MVSSVKAQQAEGRLRRIPWGIAGAGVIALGMLGAQVSAAFRGVDVPSAEPSHVPSLPDEPLSPASAAEKAKLVEFASAIVKDVDKMWSRDHRRRGKPYTHAEPVLLDVPDAEECGPGIAFDRADCFGTEKVFIDLSFQRALQKRFGKEADGPKAYAIAHELGHHVQRLLGMDKKLAALLAEKPVSSHWAEVQLELQADCFAGVWSRRTEQQQLVEPTQLETSIRRTSELGTERRIAERGDAASVGESFTYAIPRRRIYWFAQGYAHAEIDDCDTFAP